MRLWRSVGGRLLRLLSHGAGDFFRLVAEEARELAGEKSGVPVSSSMFAAMSECVGVLGIGGSSVRLCCDACSVDCSRECEAESEAMLKNCVVVASCSCVGVVGLVDGREAMYAETTERLSCVVLSSS